MAIYTIGDLHLSFGVDKPMDIFGWGNHSEKIKQNWIENVKMEDTVVLPGDFSWGMNLEEAYLDFAFLEELPGNKILSKGNHDYWWTTLTKMRRFLQEKNINTIDFLQNNSYLVEDKIIVGTRGWATGNWNSLEDYKILKRENERLKLSLQEGRRQKKKKKDILCFLHYPPFFKQCVPEEIDFLKTMQEYGVKQCFYGHLHGESHREAQEGMIREIEFKLVSSDYLNFRMKKI